MKATITRERVISAINEYQDYCTTAPGISDSTILVLSTVVLNEDGANAMNHGLDDPVFKSGDISAAFQLGAFEDYAEAGHEVLYSIENIIGLDGDWDTGQITSIELVRLSVVTDEWLAVRNVHGCVMI